MVYLEEAGLISGGAWGLCRFGVDEWKGVYIIWECICWKSTITNTCRQSCLGIGDISAYAIRDDAPRRSSDPPPVLVMKMVRDLDLSMGCQRRFATRLSLTYPSQTQTSTLRYASTSSGQNREVIVQFDTEKSLTHVHQFHYPSGGIEGGLQNSFE